jgi:transposase-like protein
MAKVSKNRRVFSDEFKQHIVQEIEQKLVTVQTVVKTYQVAESVVYKWNKVATYHYHRRPNGI